MPICIDCTPNKRPEQKEKLKTEEAIAVATSATDLKIKRTKRMRGREAEEKKMMSEHQERMVSNTI